VAGSAVAVSRLRSLAGLGVAEVVVLVEVAEEVVEIGSRLEMEAALEEVGLLLEVVVAQAVLEVVASIELQ